MYKTIESGHMFTIHEKEQYLITKKAISFLKLLNNQLLLPVIYTNSFYNCFL